MLGENYFNKKPGGQCSPGSPVSLHRSIAPERIGAVATDKSAVGSVREQPGAAAPVDCS